MSDHETNFGVECRICHSKTARDLILSPCLCKGSMGCVHIGCLEQWLNFSTHKFCELCSYKFEVIQTRKYSFCQAIVVWLCRDRKSMYKVLLFIFLSVFNSTLLIWFWFYWISNIEKTFLRETNNKDPKDKNRETYEGIEKAKWIVVFIFLILMTVLSIKSFCFDALKILRKKYRIWYHWWNKEVNIQLVVDLKNYKINAKLEKRVELPLKMVEQPEVDHMEVDDVEVDHVQVDHIEVDDVEVDHVEIDDIATEGLLYPHDKNNSEVKKSGNKVA